MRDRKPFAPEQLEARALLTTAHVGVAQPASMVAPITPINLTGTLDVDLGQASTVENSDSSMTTSVPVVGRLGSIGRVTGVWNHTLSEFGTYQGPDTLVLNASLMKGTFTIDFDNDNDGLTAKAVGKDLSDYQHAQKLASGTEKFAKVSEHGSIELMLNTDQDTYKSLVLISVPS